MVGIGWVLSCNRIRSVRGIVPSISISAIWLCCNLLCLMLVTRARVPWFQIWTCYWFIMIVLFLVLSTSCIHTLLSGTYGPEVTEIGITGREWLWCEDHMCSRSVNALLRCSIKRSTLIASSSLEAPLQTGWQDKRCCASSHCEHVWLYMEHMPRII